MGFNVHRDSEDVALACWRRETRPTTALRCSRAAQVTGCRARCARGPARLPFRVRQPSPALALPPRAQVDFHVKVHPERLKAEAEFMRALLIDAVLIVESHAFSDGGGTFSTIGVRMRECRAHPGEKVCSAADVERVRSVAMGRSRT